jgi:hypothetical protein
VEDFKNIFKVNPGHEIGIELKALKELYEKGSMR